MRKIICSILVIIFLWYVVCSFLKPPDYLFPNIDKVVKNFLESYDVYLSNTIYTLCEVIVGFVIANLLGLIIAIIVVYYPALEGVVTTLAMILKTIPIIAIAPLLVLWFGHDIGSKIAAVTITCFIPVLINVISDAKIKRGEYQNLINLYNITKLQELRHIILPGILPCLISSLKISSTLAIVGALVSEFVSANKGLGYLIISNYHSMNISGVFVCIVLSSIMGLSIYSICDYFEKKKTIFYNKQKHN